MSEQGYEQLTLFPADFLASRSAQPGSAEAVRMTVTSGQRCSELSRKFGPLGCLEKMLLESSTWRSTRCWLTWKVKATKQGRLYFQLAVSTPRTGVTEYASWAGSEERPIYFIPTPTTQNRPVSEAAKKKYKSSPSLEDYIRLWPTPTAQMGKGPSFSKTRQGGPNLQTATAMYPPPPHNRGRPLRWDRELQPAESPGGGRGDFAGGTPEHGGGERGTAEPGLGGGHDGLPAWMDEVRAGWTDGTWEAGIPRIATGVPDRVPRLKSLGNAVVPAQFYPIFQAIADIERKSEHEQG